MSPAAAPLLPSELELLDVIATGHGLAPLDRALLLARAGGAREPELLPVGERDRVILGLRTALLGAGLEATDCCPACGEKAAFSLNSRTLAAPGPKAAAIRLEQYGFVLVCRPPTSQDLRRAADAGPRSARNVLLAAIIESATLDGEPIAVAALPAGAIAEAGRLLSEADPLADIQVQLECLSCGSEWSTALDISDFAWRELQHWSRRVLWEVHTLARAYGWAEAEVLAVPPHRRHVYLEWVTNG